MASGSSLAGKMAGETLLNIMSTKVARLRCENKVAEKEE